MKGKIIFLSLFAFSVLSANEVAKELENTLVKEEKSIDIGQRLSLIEVYNMALKFDYELKTGFFEMKAADSRKSAALARLFPAIKLHAAYNGDNYEQFSQSINESYYSYGVSVNQQLFRPDLWANKDQESLRAKGSSFAYENTKQILAKKVSKAYFDLVFAKQGLLLAKSFEKAHELRYEQMQKSLSMGLVNKMDALEAKVRLDQSTLGVSKALRELDIARLSLANLVGKSIEVSDAVKYDNLASFESKDLKKYYNFAANLEYKQADIASKVAVKESDKRKREYLPSVDLYASYENNTYVDQAMFKAKDKEKNMVIRANFSLPVFDSGLTFSRVQEGKYAKQAALAKQENTRNLVELKQKQSISDFQNYIQEFRISKRALDHAMVYEQAIDAGYKEGLKDLVELLDAKARIHETKLNYIKSANSLIASYLELESLIGAIDEKLIKDLDTMIVELSTSY